ncbi:MAG: cobyrinate a,c-diamide synthase [Dehalogenimonas sp.]|uniref:Cobyrinate a,c-diamide synthase n=1 Tax=Candidatus Dehalogenimonas loeffleri TaxID=3127115 RepID=A0ABZ2J2Q0_9CHLR|nr:cobyrinate a,c-diamide synthase [Dehalogenimonas sp.]
MKIPRIVIAGTSSGVGKTTIATGIAYALKRRALKVQPFKCGPDYIDPGYLSIAAGRDCHNLDTWMLPEDHVKELFAYFNRTSDLAIIEGVMGLFDGHRASAGTSSTAHIAKVTDSPVILILNVAKMGQSAAALAYGFAHYDPDVKIAGIILNQVGSPSHLETVKGAIEQNCGIPVIGSLAKNAGLTLPERHLGLVPAVERNDNSGFLDQLGDLIESTIDLDRLIEIAGQAPEFYPPETPVLFPADPQPVRCRMAVAKDEAFNFYYQANIELLRAWGAEITYFSPVADTSLPAGTEGVYIGGGFPEVFLKELEDNTSMKESIKAAVAAGLPVYAECGGLMYLTQGIVDFEGQSHDMIGLLPGLCRMQGKLQRLGYTEAEVLKESPVAERGQQLRGHMFHWSHLDTPDENSAAYHVVEPKKQLEGFVLGPGNNLLASYLHLHFGSDARMAKHFVDRCARS